MKYLSGQQIRMMWLDFFKGKGHHVEKGASLIPYKDPSLLWINSGVAALKKYMDGSEVPPSRRITNVQKSIRKSLGHAAMFMVAQVFTFLTLYMFFYDKKWWFYSAISVGGGLFLSGLSELIQFFIPSRDGTFIDVLIDFAGVIVGAALTFLGIYIVKKIKEKKSQKETSKNN